MFHIQLDPQLKHYSLSPTSNSDDISDPFFDPCCGDDTVDSLSCVSLIIGEMSISSASHSAFIMMERSLICMSRMSDWDVRLDSCFKCQMAKTGVTGLGIYLVLIR